MSQAGYTPIQLYYSATAAATPPAGNMAAGELAVNITDGKLFYKDNGGTVRVLAGTGGSGVVAGSNTQVQFNNNGVFGASANLTFDGTNLGLSGGTANGVAYLNGSKVLTTGSGLQFDGTNLGLGVTPSAWDTGKAFEINAVGTGLWGAFGNTYLNANNYYNAADKFAGTGYAVRYLQVPSNGQHQWLVSTASGTAGNAISFTQAVTLTANGEYLVGLTSATGVAKLQVSGAIRTTGFTVATLPAGTVGMRTYVTDALAPSFSATVVGGGAVTIPVFYNGSNWIVA